ncbi:cytochrome c maturation protein CcmE [Micromonospora sp. NPDC006431]|uniref:cytochrome c maturation protein CcmE n=1 Tax=Micromonospora sp. NPDC006431 TaxID=3364235 RepID=UPI0036CE4FAC
MRRRTGRVALLAVLLAAGGLLVTSALRDTVTYYRTPAELLDDPDLARHRVRLGGDVVPGSLRHDGDLVTFRLAAAGREIAVEQRGAPPETFREGTGAVVEGTLSSDGVFRSDHVVVRHGNEYRPSSPPVAPVDAR